MRLGGALFAAGERHGLEDAFVADLGLLIRALAAHLFGAGFLRVVLKRNTCCHITPTQIVRFSPRALRRRANPNQFKFACVNLTAQPPLGGEPVVHA